MSALGNEPDSLTVAEAVPLSTVFLQRLFLDAGIRSLAIKGPAFATIGVRQVRQSNDVDLLIHPRDRVAANEVLAAVNWNLVSLWVPETLNDALVSDTYRHEVFPVTLDLHHSFPGLLTWPDPFECMWNQKQAVAMAGQEVLTLGTAQALVLEALNTMKGQPPHAWSALIASVVKAAAPQDVQELVQAAEDMGARHSASALMREVGAPNPEEQPPEGYDAWLNSGRSSKFSLTFRAMARDPLNAPLVLRQELFLSEEMARFWANRRGGTFHSRRQVFLMRAQRRLRRLAGKFSRSTERQRER